MTPVISNEAISLDCPMLIKIAELLSEYTDQLRGGNERKRSVSAVIGRTISHNCLLDSSKWILHLSEWSLNFSH